MSGEALADRPATFHDLEGASVFVTGGGSGIGAALVEGFLAQGARVAFVDIDAPTAKHFCEAAAARTGRAPHFVHCDIRDLAALEAAAAEAAAINGPTGILVNNAARDDRHTLESFSAADWDDSLAINLRPAFFTAKAVAPGMVAAGGGAIVNVSSNSFLLGLAGYPAYVTAKAGLAGMTKALSRELGPHGIRVNCLIPGWVMTERQRALWVTPEALARCLESQSLKRTIDPVDMVPPCLFLASKASAMMTGQTLVVDGGIV